MFRFTVAYSFTNSWAFVLWASFVIRHLRGNPSQSGAVQLQRERPKRFPQSIRRVALRKLRMLHRATTLADLRVPSGNRLESLGGDRKGKYGIRVNNLFRICFTRRSGDAFDVQVVDDH